jgi:hypothetical protein
MYRGIHCDNSKLAYIIHWLNCPHHFFPLIISLTPLQAIARCYIVLFCIGMWCPSTIFSHLISFVHPSPPISTPHVLYLFYSPIFHYQFLNQCSKGFLNVFPLWINFIFVHSTPSIPLPLPIPSLHISKIFNTYHYNLYLHRCCFMILLMPYHPHKKSSVKRILHKGK